MKKKKERGWIANNYKLCWKYLKESRNYFLFVILVFAAFSLVGFFYPKFFAEQILEFMKQLSERVEGMNFFQLFVFIFENNLTAAFVSLVLGIIFGIFPMLTGVFNGYILGFVSRLAINKSGFAILFRLLPHGIFELPALIISLGLGLRLGMFFLAREKKKYLVYNFENSLRVFLYVILPLLLIAAVIEAGLMFLI